MLIAWARSVPALLYVRMGVKLTGMVKTKVVLKTAQTVRMENVTILESARMVVKMASTVHSAKNLVVRLVKMTLAIRRPENAQTVVQHQWDHYAEIAV